jgi:hemoglobin
MKKLSAVTALYCCVLTVALMPPGFAQTAAESDAVYQGLGGKQGIQKIVDRFLPIVLADVRIKDVFKDIDIDRLGLRLAEQFCQLSGGPCKYSGKDMKTIHADLAITNAQFNALTEDLQSAMEQQGIPSYVQNKLVAKLAPMQRHIVTK